MSKLKVLDLFSGIGGFSLGLERSGGFETIAFCEIEPYCRKVLAKHWPGVPCYEDIRTLTADTLRRDGLAPDVICGGFPCQDVSFAGKRAGIEGARSGLWREYARVIGELRPRFAIVENVPGLLNLGMGTVLGDLSALGYDAIWDCIPASAVGAPHRRDRVWVVAYAAGKRCGETWADSERSAQWIASSGNVLAHTNNTGSQRRDGAKLPECFSERASEAGGSHVAHSERIGQPPAGNSKIDGATFGNGETDRIRGRGEVLANASRELQQWRGAGTEQAGRGKPSDGGWWESEPDVGRVASGVPSRVDRLRSLGNAVVPQIPELIGKAIMQAEGMT